MTPDLTQCTPFSGVFWRTPDLGVVVEETLNIARVTWFSDSETILRLCSELASANIQWLHFDLDRWRVNQILILYQT